MRTVLILFIILLVSCKKEKPEPAPYAPPGWSRTTPTLLLPANGAHITGASSINFAWSSIPDADRYTLHVRKVLVSGDTVEVGSMWRTDTTMSWGTVHMTADRPIIWRVNAINNFAAAPNASPWSDWFTFTRQ